MPNQCMGIMAAAHGTPLTGGIQRLSEVNLLWKVTSFVNTVCRYAELSF